MTSRSETERRHERATHRYAARVGRLHRASRRPPCTHRWPGHRGGDAAAACQRRRPTSGGIWFQGESIVGKRKHEITRSGIARTFQNVRLFPEMTALENVMVGADAHHKTSVIGALFRLPRHWREERSGRNRSMELLRFVGIERRAGEVSRSLSYGEQRRLEIARALATNPTLLCLDEPAAGFNPAEKADLLALIRRIRDTGVTILLIEHDMRLVMGVTDRIVVLEFGKKIAEGTPHEVRDNPAVIAAYLGVPADAA